MLHRIDDYFNAYWSIKMEQSINLQIFNKLIRHLNEMKNGLAIADTKDGWSKVVLEGRVIKEFVDRNLAEKFIQDVKDGTRPLFKKKKKHRPVEY